MSNEREPYIRPIIMRLEYTTDVRVSQATGCKAESSEVGPSTTGCVAATPPIVPCTQPVS
ncbi:MAG TPA: hypothetical protein VFB46_08450 [Gemmatimonadaceae bacterium]|nr:hypothetical protein [Gemmatimonadaceae bacterium]